MLIAMSQYNAILSALKSTRPTLQGGLYLSTGSGAELEPGHGSPGHRVTGSVILSGSGRVSGQRYLLTDPVL